MPSRWAALNPHNHPEPLRDYILLQVALQYLGRHIHSKGVRMRIPQHVGFIMDGNGRWAKQRGLPRSAGHRAGLQHIRDVGQTHLNSSRYGV